MNIKHLEVNDYIDFYSEIEETVEDIAQDVNVELVELTNDGCKLGIVKKIVKELNQRDIQVRVINKWVCGGNA